MTRTASIYIEDEVETTDATPRNNEFVLLPNNSVSVMTGSVVAVRLSDGATKAWAFRALFKKVGGVTTFCGTEPTSVPPIATAGDATALSGVTIAPFSSSTHVGIVYTGAAATTVRWIATLDVVGSVL